MTIDHHHQFISSCRTETFFENLGAILFQPISKLIDVKHVGGKSLGTHSNQESGSVLIQFKKDQSHSEEHAQYLQPTLVFLC
jgi:hypothetical protein